MEVGESRWWWPGITVTTAALLVISTLLVYVVVVQLRRKSFPPGPWPLPIFGNLGVLSGLPHRNLHKLAAKYGGLMYLQLGTHCSGSLVSQMLAAESNSVVEMVCGDVSNAARVCDCD